MGCARAEKEWRRAYQEDNGNVKHKGNDGVEEQSPDTDVVDVAHGQVGNLKEESGGTVHDSADGSKVVERHQGVHLVFGRAEQTLDHDETGGLEDDTTDLEEETDEDETDLTERGNNDTKHNDADVHQDLVVDGSHSHTPGCEQHSDRSSSLFLTISFRVRYHGIEREENSP